MVAFKGRSWNILIQISRPRILVLCVVSNYIILLPFDSYQCVFCLFGSQGCLFTIAQQQHLPLPTQLNCSPMPQPPYVRVFSRAWLAFALGVGMGGERRFSQGWSLGLFCRTVYAYMKTLLLIQYRLFWSNVRVSNVQLLSDSSKICLISMGIWVFEYTYIFNHCGQDRVFFIFTFAV